MPIQPPKSDAYPSTKPSPMRHLSEFAVADSPGASGPEQDYAADDDDYDDYYLDSRFVSAHVNAAAAAAAPAAGYGGGGGPEPRIARPEGEVESGRARHAEEGAEAGWRPGGLPLGGGNERAGASASRGGEGGGGMPGAVERGVRGGGTVVHEAAEQPAAERRATNVDAQGKMAPTYPEGQVAHAVEGARRDAERARAQAQAQGGGSSGAGGCPGCMHGRGRGEVTLQANEAGLERKKQQQAAARKQVVDARRRGEDVDGRGLGGPSGRQPRAEVD
ncbi:5bf9e24b-d824-4808-8298-0023527227de [Thermothielavioides terrestris]|uniref:5bf9e24b-d824-4808-8298-0023527227de n=1 Tax=Thermothielavioides terrestris TaxID=2587410 RepID=A0A3S5CXQ8_9PEZI|nr:5bf9e24b-d824-4808-8298-0023527227de [Thermothielavioides terrestris]